MATSSTRQRKLARAKLDRQLAKRAEQERRQRQLRAVGAALAVLLITVAGGLWIGGVFDKEPATPPVAGDCSWNPQNVAANANLKDVGTPRTTGIPNTGINLMTLNLNAGIVKVELDRTLARCASEGMAYLASSGYFNNTTCHELTAASLRCGDHSGTGDGGAAFTWVPENVPAPAPIADASADPSAPPDPSAAPDPSASPAAPTIRYPAGTVAMQPGITGSQFLIFFEDSTASEDYSIVGRVTSGLEVVKQIAQKGAVDNGKGANTKPKDEVMIQSLTVVDPLAQASTEPSAPPSTEPSTQPSATATPNS